MKLKTMISAILCTLFLAGATLAETSKWHTDYKAAVAESEKSGKPILMDFTGSDWCGWCIKLKKEVFNTNEFQTWASKNVVLLELDYPNNIEQSEALKAQNQSLLSKYKIQGYPTIVFANAKGKELGRYGYDAGGPAVWTKKADTMLK